MGGRRDQRFGKQSSSSTVLKIDASVKKIGSLCLPEETALAGALFAGEEEISRFSRGAAVTAPAVHRALPAPSSGHDGPCPAGAASSAARASPSRRTAGWDGPSSAASAAERDQSRREAGGGRSWDGLWGGGTGREGQAPGEGHCGTRPGVIWRLRGARRGAPGTAAPPAAAAPARPPSAGPPPPAAGSC